MQASALPLSAALAIAAFLPAQQPYQGLLWSTFVGGEADEYLQDIARDAFGRLYVCGRTSSQLIPTTPSAFDTTPNGGWDAYVACIDPLATGPSQLVWASLIGGSAEDAALAIAVDPIGRFVTVGGATSSPGFPRTHGNPYSGQRDAFVLRFDLWQTGANQLVWSHLLGGSGMDWVSDLVVDPTGVVTAAGMTASQGFPTTPGAFDRTLGGSSDAFVVRLQANGNLQWSTLLGGSAGESHWPTFSLEWYYDRRLRVAVDGRNRPIVAGSTFSADFPVTANASQPVLGGGTDIFVSRLDAAGASLEFSTFYGGTLNDWLVAMALDEDGGVSITANTYSNNCATTANAWSRSPSSTIDALLVRLVDLDAQVARLDYATYLGGNGDDVFHEVMREASGAFVLVGGTGSSNFPTTSGAPRRSLEGPFDVALVRLQPDAGSTRLLMSTLVGGSLQEAGFAAILDGAGGVFGVSQTTSPGFPVTPGAMRAVHQGLHEAAVWHHPLLPDGLTRVGPSTPACRGPIAMQVESQPAPGNTGFAVRCDDAPPLGIGVLAIGQPLSSGLPAPVLNAWSWILPTAVLGAIADGQGFASTSIPVPQSLPPSTAVGFQWFWVNTPNCSVLGISTSNALRWN